MALGLGNVFGFVTNIFKPAADLVDNLHTSDEERLTLRNQLVAIRAATQEKMLEYESELLAARSSVISAEASAASWLSRSWRPITMLAFVAVLIYRWIFVGFAPELEAELLSIVKWGLSGYIVGRTAEKIVGKA